MSKATCPLCGAEMELPDGLPLPRVACPACGGDFAPSDRPSPPEDERPAGEEATAAAGLFRMDTRAITQAMPTPTAPPGGPVPARGPDPLGAYRSDTLGPAAPVPFRPPGLAPDDDGEEDDGDCFGPFELLEQLGSSDVAMTYRARRRAQGDLVTLKVLAPGKTATGEEVAALVERARAARRLKHDGIVRVLDVGKRDGSDYVASSHLEGNSLADVLDLGGPELTDAVEITRALAWALDHAHNAGVVHGNVSPSNVIIDAPGKPHLTDFGLARELWRLSPEDLRTSAGGGFALPLYMAPEQLRGEPPTRRSDVYSLGALLYHMTALRPPFASDDIFELVIAIDAGDPPPPAAVNIRVPPAVNAIIMKCLEREPRNRFATAEALASDIERFLHGKRVHAKSPGAAGRLVRGVVSRWRASAAVLVLASAAAAGAWFAARSDVLPETVAAFGGDGARAEAAIRAADDLAGRKLWGEVEARLQPVASAEDLPARLRAAAAARVGVARFRRGAYGEAADSFSRAIGIRPGGQPELHYYYGVALWHAGGDPREVARELRRALELDPARARSPEFLYDYARACDLAGQAPEAARAFGRVRALDRTYKPALVSGHLERLAR